MPLSNTFLSVLRRAPYYDDFDASKGFLRMLFRPGFGVQTRELTQLQTILQAQISRLGTHLFKDGVPVTGGQLTYSNTAETLRVALTFGGGSVNANLVWNANTFTGAVVTGVTSGAQGRVVGTQLSADQSSREFVILPLGTAAFQANETLSTPSGNSSVSFAQIISDANTATRPATIVSIDQGVYFLRDFFIQIPAQTIIVDSTSDSVTARVGLTVNETIVNETQDSSLLDPALGRSFGAAGAHRLVVSGTLDKRTLTSTALETGAVTAESNFLDLMRIDSGVVTKNLPATLQSAIYRDLETNLAGRTFDEAGNYLVNPFVLTFGTPSQPLHGSVSVTSGQNAVTGNGTIFTTELNTGDRLQIGSQTLTITSVANDTVAIANTTWSSSLQNQMATRTRPRSVTASLGPGKAYIQGYEFATIGTTKLDMPKARDVAQVSNDTIPTLYGNYTYVTALSNLAVLPLPTLDMHCVIPANIISTNAATYATTWMGTAKLRNLVPDSFNDDGTLVYRAYLRQIATKTYSNTVATGSNASAGLINLTAGAQSNGAYTHARLTLTDTNGNTDTYTVTAYVANSTQQTVTTDRPVAGLTVNTSTVYSVGFQFGQLESLVTANIGGALLNSTTVSPLGQFNSQTVLTQSERGRMLFPVPHQFIQQGSYNNTTYTIWEYFSNTHSSNTCTVVTANTAQRFFPAVNYTYSTAEIAKDFIIATANGQVLTTANIASITNNLPANTDVHTLTIHTLGTTTNALAIWTRVNLTRTVFRTKTLTGAPLSGSWTGNLSDGQIANTTPNTSPNGITSLGVADIVSVVKVVDSGNTSTAVSNTVLANTLADVTSHFRLDTGQRDGRYDHATLILKPGFAPPQGQLGVLVTRFTHTGTGPVVVDSYANTTYEAIPTYTRPSGAVFPLRDVVDFRPVRDTNANTYSNIEVPDPGSSMLTNYAYYLGRVDKIILTAHRQLQRLAGTSAITPVAPPDQPGAMSLYIVTFNPYTLSTALDIRQQAVGQKRYTMADIGVLDQRISRLEQYASLSLLESVADNTPLFSDTNLERFKNGILVDPFTGATVADVTNPDFAAAIDAVGRRLMPRFVSNAITFTLTPNASSNVTLSPDGSQIFPVYQEVPVITQPLASESIPVNPFNVTAFRGSIILTPASDIWYDTTVAPAVTVDATGGAGAAALANVVTQTVWGDWQTNWAGASPATVTANATAVWVSTPTENHPWQQQLVETTTIDTTQQLQRTGQQLQISPTTVTSDLGSRVVNVSTVPYCRSANISFVATGLKPNAAIYPYLDSTPMAVFTARANELILDTTTALFDDSSRGLERVSSVAGGVGTAVFQNGNVLKVVDVNANGAFQFANGVATLLTGLTSNATANVIGSTHWSGMVQAANTTTVTLQQNASANNGFYTGQPIFLVAGTGLGTKGIITAYNVGVNKVASVSGLSIIPDTTTRYSIGTLTSDAATAGQTTTNTTPFITAGLVAGMLYLPSATVLPIPTGTKTFRLSDSPGNVSEDITTLAEAPYTSLGTLDTTQDVSISTRAYQVSSSIVSEVSNVTTTTSSSQVISYIDPLAETFLVDAINFPQGFILTRCDLYFATKDSVGIPVRLQLRPVVNGFPDSSTVLGEVWLSPSRVNASTTPDVTNDATATTFTFPRPIQLQPGTEYALVVLSDSQDYKVYSGTIGEQILNGAGIISSQPYAGSLFKSQNASTWTPVQEQDLMFRLKRASFTPGDIAFASMTTAVSANVIYDAVFLNPSGIAPVANSTITFGLRTTNANGNLRDTVSNLSLPADVTANVTAGRSYMFSGAGNTCTLTGTWQPASESMAAWLDLSRLGLTLIENVINNGELTAGVITIDNPGSGYPASNTSLPVVITSNTGNGAVAIATTNSSGAITAITLTSSGSGYTTSPTMVVNAANTTNAVITVHGEDRSSGGNGLVHYITKTVTLADGFDSADLHIVVDVYRPAGTNVTVYRKVLNSADPATITNRPWEIMTLETDPNTFSANPGDIRTFTYTTPNLSAAYTSNNVTYLTFKQYAVKVVLTTSDPTVAPWLKDIQILAMDS